MAARRKPDPSTSKSTRNFSSIKEEVAALQAQIQQLNEEAHAARSAEVAEVVAKIKLAIADYGITASDLGLSTHAVSRGRVARGVGRAKGAAEAKYRNSEGQVWGGRGPRPAWLREAIAAGHALEEFAV